MKVNLSFIEYSPTSPAVRDLFTEPELERGFASGHFLDADLLVLAKSPAAYARPPPSNHRHTTSFLRLSLHPAYAPSVRPACAPSMHPACTLHHSPLARVNWLSALGSLLLLPSKNIAGETRLRQAKAHLFRIYRSIVSYLSLHCFVSVDQFVS